MSVIYLRSAHFIQINQHSKDRNDATKNEQENSIDESIEWNSPVDHCSQQPNQNHNRPIYQGFTITSLFPQNRRTFRKLISKNKPREDEKKKKKKKQTKQKHIRKQQTVVSSSLLPKQSQALRFQNEWSTSKSKSIERKIKQLNLGCFSVWTITDQTNKQPRVLSKISHQIDCKKQT